MTLRVLVVEDDESSRYLIASILRAHDIEVVEAVDGVDGLARGRETPVDVVVSDILMPNMDGYQLCREWKADPELSRIPVVFYSATYTDAADMEFARNLGVDAFLIKPLDPDVLVAEIRGIAVSDETSPARSPEALEETEVLRGYSARLVAKLEQKVEELNDTNADLSQALEVLTDEIEVKSTLIQQLTADMAERRRAQDELTESNELLNRIIDSSPLALVAVDLDWRVRLWNPGATRLLGWTEEEALGEVYPPAAGRVEDFNRTYAPIMSGAEDRMQVEALRQRKDGSTVEVRAYIAALHGSDGAVRGLLSLFVDITSERQIEMVKSDFMSMVSHELRTPLTSIIGYSDLLEQVDLQRKPELFEQILGKIRDRGNRMRSLIDDLLEVSQVQSGPLRLQLTLEDVVAIVREELEKAEASPAHELSLLADEDVPEIYVDRERFARVIRQLVSNAVKYSPDGGLVRVEIHRAGSDVRISVSDQGIGIEAVDLEHIFDSFTQADMSDTRTYGGIGVGLFLARQIVEAHRGSIEVNSKPGMGATFTVTLPVTG